MIPYLDVHGPQLIGELDPVFEHVLIDGVDKHICLSLCRHILNRGLILELLSVNERDNLVERKVDTNSRSVESLLHALVEMLERRFK